MSNLNKITCAFCDKTVKEAGGMRKIKARGKSRKYACIKCRYIYGLSLRTNKNIKNANEILSRHNRPNFELCDFEKTYRTDVTLKATTKITKKKTKEEKKQYYLTREEAQLWLSKQYKLYQKSATIIHFQGKGYKII